jgi:hypothetical protein
MRATLILTAANFGLQELAGSLDRAEYPEVHSPRRDRVPLA